MAHTKLRGTGKGIAWILARVSYNGDDCQFWPLHCHPKTGYGEMSLNGKIMKAHRHMCELAHGLAPSPLHQAAHECGNRNCCNPRHLSWKTPSGNQLDRRKHGTTSHWQWGKNPKLSPEQRAEIIEARGQKTQQELADEFGVTFQTISYIQRQFRVGASLK